MTFPPLPPNNTLGEIPQNPVGLISAQRDPTGEDFGYPEGWIWQNTNNGTFWICVSSGLPQANWNQFIPAGIGAVTSVTGIAPITAVPTTGNVNVSLTGIVPVPNGGTGDSSFTAYAPVCGGTTSTTPLQSAPTGQSNVGYVLTSTGNASLPTWQPPTGGSGDVQTLTGNTGGAISPVAGNINVVGDASSITIGGAGNTLTASLIAPVSIANGGTNATSMTNTDGACYFDGTKINTTLVGISGQVLTSNGPGMPPTFQATSLALIASSTPTGGSVTIALPAYPIFENFLIYIANVFPVNNGDKILAQVSIDGGATYLSTGYSSGTNVSAFNSTALTNYNITSGFLLSGNVHSSGAGGGLCGSYLFYNLYNPGLALNGFMNYIDSASPIPYTGLVNGISAQTAVATNLLFKSSSGGGLLTFGTISVYGIFTTH